MDDELQRLRELSARLLRLHAQLLERERRAYEAAHGGITSRELLQLLLGDEGFAWLRSLSRMIASIDEALDADTALTPLDAQTFFREAHRLLRSGGTDVFATKYAEALQDSPDVVMAHADVVKTLPRPQEHRRE